MTRTLHVRADSPAPVTGLRTGTEESPFARIGDAAAVAMPGDTVLVHDGVYREWVKPRRGGRSDRRRITYAAAEGCRPVITGAEQITDWVDEGDGVWSVTLPNTVFGDVNPYREVLRGDWLLDPDPAGPAKHLGEVFLDGEALFEVTSLAELRSPAERTDVRDVWTGKADPTDRWQHGGRVWHCEAGDETTTIRANFGDADPNERLAEITVRRSVFFPVDTHVDYITVRGFELRQAATPWAPPTGDQPGLIGPKWAQGWVIEDNLIHHAKCAAVSLGKDASTGDNFHSERWDKPGYQYQLESVFSAEKTGWSREHVGSHVVRRNLIRDCGQNGIVGHLGCVFSRIEDNDISRIATRREYFGHEIAGIKLHAPIDVVIEHNRIHECSLGIWLDWQTQGTRITRNVLHDNDRDLFIEVSHGPYVVDFNVLASPASIENVSQGGAYLHNLLLGTLRCEPVRDRATPYHFPHSTQVAGYAVIEGGDDRYRGNLFAGTDREAAYDAEHWLPRGSESIVELGLSGLDAFPRSLEEYIAARRALGNNDHNCFLGATQPVWADSNAYGPAAAPLPDEDGAVRADAELTATVAVEDEKVFLELDLPAAFVEAAVDAHLQEPLPPTRFSACEFDAPDGGELVFQQDLLGTALADSAAPGPISGLEAGRSRVRIW